MSEHFPPVYNEKTVTFAKYLPYIVAFTEQVIKYATHEEKIALF